MQKHNHKHTHKHGHSHETSVADIDIIAHNSPLSCVNSGLKMLFAITLLIIAIAFDSLYFGIFLAFVMLILLQCGTKLHFHTIFQLMLIPIVFICISTIAIVVQISAEVPSVEYVKAFGLYFFVTKTAIIGGFKLFFRAYSAVLCTYFLAVTTPIGEIIRIMQKCRFPKVFTELMYMIYRYLFVLFEVQRKLKISASARLGNVSYMASWRSFCGICSGVLISSFKRSSACFDALEARGYDGDINFYSEVAKVKASHVAFAVMFVAVVIAVAIACIIMGV